MSRRVLHVFSVAAAFLLCFPAAATAQGETQIQDWWYTETRDEMTDEVTALTLTQSDAESLSFGFLCRSYEPIAILSVNDPSLRLELITMGGNWIEVQARLGENEATQKYTWTPLGNAEYEAYDAPQEFSYKLLRGAQHEPYMRLRIWNSEGKVVATERFSLMGATEANLKLPCVVKGTFNTGTP